MARPRVFVSSTFYDLKQIRADLEQFIKEVGFDPVLHERGAVTYGGKESLEEYCLREIRQVELLVSVVGGRFGSSSEHGAYSISQQELKTAYDLGIKVFIFVESAVLSEYQTYRKNKHIAEVAYTYADDTRIYAFLEEVHGLPNNNSITPFSSAQDITTFLREQWAGMFQRFLQTQGKEKEITILKNLQANMQTLDRLITYLTEEKQNSDDTIREILRASHPIFQQLRTVLDVGHRVFFTTRAELTEWLATLNFTYVAPEHWDDPEHAEWLRSDPFPSLLLKISKDVFDDKGDLVIYTAQQWRSEWITTKSVENTDDDIPF